jgi:hypothetical protein
MKMKPKVIPAVRCQREGDESRLSNGRNSRTKSNVARV